MVSISPPPGVIAGLISDCLDGRLELHPFWASLARRHSVLPIFGDFMGFWALSESGQLMFIPDEDHSRIEPVEGLPQERHLIHAALAQAALRFPALASFCPQRTAADQLCTKCDGLGRLPGVPENVLCECGGAGWIPMG